MFLDQLRATIGVAMDAGPAEEYAVDPSRADALTAIFRAERGD